MDAAKEPSREGNPRKREDIRKRISPERLKLLERIEKRRKSIGPIGFSLTDMLREMRENGE
ncbi:MAG: hypothetical protein E3J72_05350 [Planctomycetota bacterium]|nr:MAG: hypothetical protein E3J72_05350 [Planctomycetota bacterium]